MDKEKSAVADFLGEFANKETVNPFEDNLKDPFAQEESAPEEEEVVEEKPLPFHKDPKVQRFVEKEVNRRLAEREPEVQKREVTRETPQEDGKVTEVLTRLIGNDTPEKVSVIKEFQNILEQGTQRAKSEAIAELESRQNAALEADQQAEEELESAFEDIEENYGVDISSNNPIARKTRQEFVSFVERIAPKDRNGDIIDYPDMTSAWETFSEIKKSTGQPSRAKELAARSMTRSSEVSSVAPTRRTTWEDADTFIDSLK